MGSKKSAARSASPAVRRSQPPRGTAPPEDFVDRAAASLLPFLPAQRWFGGKARTITGVSLLDHAVVPGTAGRLALFEIVYADDAGEIYQVPIAPGAAASPFADAMDDRHFCLALLEQIRLAGCLPGLRGMFRFTPTEALPHILPDVPNDVARVRTEQSNTSVIFDHKAILKLFRKLETGPNPDYEITEFLTRQTSFHGTPRLGGAVSYEAADGKSATLAILQEFVPNQGDAWTVTQGRLAEYYAAVGGAAGDGREPDQAFARTLAAADAKEAERLGRLTGGLHMTLASAPAGTALTPERIRPEDLATWQQELRAHLDRVMGTLAATIEKLPEPVRIAAQDVLDNAAQFKDGLMALQALGTEPVTKIRIHGDYHLGQVLRSGDDFFILDFEGEPARPLEERRAKQCALKDVAGMLRSFAYAARAAKFRVEEAAPGDRGLGERLASWAEVWEDGVRSAFLDGYLAETWNQGATFLPRGREALEAVLHVYELDKAIYELNYEINHRPAWVRIPLEGLRRTRVTAPKPTLGRLRSGEGPFSFVACLELLEFVGVRAENERQLADLLEEVPLDSIYYHTHSFFLRHKFAAGTYPNDFATWAAIQVRDRTLGERLAMVDPGLYPNLQALREELVAVIDDHLRDLHIVPGPIVGEPFEFIQSQLVEIPTGHRAGTLQEFRDVLLEVDLTAIYYHLMESRMRLGRGQNDFAAWVERGLGLPNLAAKFRAVDPYAGSLEQTRLRLVQLCDEVLAEGVGL
jgi:trehalose synthase-fused probable maltokinase